MTNIIHGITVGTIVGTLVTQTALSAVTRNNADLHGR